MNLPRQPFAAGDFAFGAENPTSRAGADAGAAILCYTEHRKSAG